MRSHHDTTTEGKTEVSHNDLGDGQESPPHYLPHHRRLRHSKVSLEVERIDAIALSATTTAESFKHLDEKKILRKVRPPLCVHIFTM